MIDFYDAGIVQHRKKVEMRSEKEITFKYSAYKNLWTILLFFLIRIKVFTEGT